MEQERDCRPVEDQLGCAIIPHAEPPKGDTRSAVLQDCLETFPYVRLSVTGRCMMPALCPGDAVTIAPRTRRTPRWGDIVLVRQPDGMRLHRLVWRWPSAFGNARWLTKADRSAEWDPPADPRSILGTMIQIEAPAGTPPRRTARAIATLESLLVGFLTWVRIRLGRRGASA
jgi:hypothetical protein